MKNTRLFLFTFLLVISVVISACNQTPTTFTINFESNGGNILESITYDGNSSITIPDNPTKEGYVFDGWYWDNETFNRSFTASSLLNEPISSNLTIYAKWILQDSELKIQLKGIYTLAVQTSAFLGTYEEWLETVRGSQGVPGVEGKSAFLRMNNAVLEWQQTGDTTWIPLMDFELIRGANGIDGHEVLFQVADGYIQWQYQGDLVWKNLIELTSLTGAQGNTGSDGVDGEQVSLQVNQTHIQWKYTNDTVWKDLISLDLLVGAKGDTGDSGVDGKEVNFQVADGYIQWQYQGDLVWKNLIELTTLTGTTGIDGIDGREVLFQVADGYIQWQYQGDLVWKNLIELSILVGPSGIDGIKGADGKDIELRVNNNILEWRYSETETWYFLYDLILLKGADAIFPIVTINDDGYWVINGEVLTQRAYTVEQFNVNFNLQGGVMPDSYPMSFTVDKGNSMNLPIPTYEGYIFKGWMTGFTINDAKFNNYLPVTKDTNLYAEWEIDESYINIFFDQMYENHAFEYSMLVSFTNGVDEYFCEINDQYIFNHTDGLPYEYLNNQLDYYLPIIGNISREYRSYTEYGSNNSENIVARLMGNGFWRFEMSDEGSLYDHYLFGVERDKFIKRPDVLLYDYEGDISFLENPFLSFFSMYGLSLNSEINYSSRETFVNFNNNTLTHFATGTVDIPNFGLSSFTFSSTYLFNDFDETTMSLPLDMLKQSVSDEMNLEIQNKLSDEYIDYVYEYSLIEFQTLVTTKQNLLAEIDNLLDLTLFYQNSLDTIENFNFAYDEFGIRKINMINLMHFSYLRYSETATTESVDNMYEIYLTYEDAVLSLNDFEDYLLEDLYPQFSDEIFAAYFQDLDKLAFEKYRESIAYHLYIFVSYISDVISDYQDKEAYIGLIFEYIDLIEQQTTLAEVHAVFDQAILEITSVTYPLAMYPGYLAEMGYGFIYYLEEYQYYSSDPENYINYIQSQNALYIQEDPHQWGVEAIELYQSAHAYIINGELPIVALELQSYVDELSLLISTEDAIKLQSELDKLLLLLPQAFTIMDFNTLIETFEMNSEKFPLDPWKETLNNARIEVENEYIYLMLTADVDSEILLTTDFNNFILLLEGLTIDDYINLELLVQDTLTILLQDYVTANEFLDWFQTKQEYLLLWEEFYLSGLPYVDLTYQNTDELEAFYEDIKYTLKISESLVDLETYYTYGIFSLCNSDYIYLPIYDFKDSLSLLMENYIADWYNIYHINSADVNMYLVYFYDGYSYQDSPYQVYDLYLDYRIMLDYQILDTMRDYYYDVLETAYYEYFNTIGISYLDNLQIVYSEYVEILDRMDVYSGEIEWTDFDDLINEFHANVGILTN